MKQRDIVYVPEDTVLTWPKAVFYSSVCLSVAIVFAVFVYGLLMTV